ncbi:hypothetical protein KCU59_g5235, partial [Aureobasidium melanogenum]
MAPTQVLIQPPSVIGEETAKITLTTYPRSSGVAPVPLNWGASTPAERGPILVSRSGDSLFYRNAIGAHGGSYSVYNALAIASGDL